jgi:hypothetical protein
MGRLVNAEGIMSGGELSVKFIERAVNQPGRYYDGWGSGLMLEVGPNGRASWVLRYMRDKKERWHGLGSLTDVTTRRSD